MLRMFESGVDHPLVYGPGTEGYGPSYILVQAFVSGLLDALGEWPLHERWTRCRWRWPTRRS